jgi:hypothetical protein
MGPLYLAKAMLLLGTQSGYRDDSLESPLPSPTPLLPAFLAVLCAGHTSANFCFRAMASPAARDQFLRQMEQIVEGIKQSRMKVSWSFFV